MENIIVTITDSERRFFYDIEVPAGVPAEHLRGDITEALNGYNPGLFLRAGSCCLFCNRLNRLLQDGETMESAGVLNGDYITIKEV